MNRSRWLLEVIHWYTEKKFQVHKGLVVSSALYNFKVSLSSPSSERVSFELFTNFLLTFKLEVPAIQPVFILTVFINTIQKLSGSFPEIFQFSNWEQETVLLHFDLTMERAPWHDEC